MENLVELLRKLNGQNRRNGCGKQYVKEDKLISTQSPNMVGN